MKFETFMNRDSDLVRKMLIAWFDASRSHFDVSRSKCPHNDHIALVSTLFKVFSCFQWQKQVSIAHWNQFNNLILLLKVPLETHAFQTSKGIPVGIEGEQLQLLYFLDVHHTGFGEDTDFVQFSQSHRNFEPGIAITVICSHID